MRASLLLVAVTIVLAFACVSGQPAAPAAQKCQIVDGTFYSANPAACTAAKCKDNQGEFPSYDTQPGTPKCPSGQGCCPVFGKPAGVSDLRAKRLAQQTALKAERAIYGGKKIPSAKKAVPAPPAAAAPKAGAAPAPAAKKVAGPPSALRQQRLANLAKAKAKKTTDAWAKAREKLELERAYPKCKSDCEWHNGPACREGYTKCRAYLASCLQRCGPAPGKPAAPLTAAQQLDANRARAAARGW